MNKPLEEETQQKALLAEEFKRKLETLKKKIIDTIIEYNECSKVNAPSEYTIILSNLQNFYTSKYNEILRPSDYGFDKIRSLIQSFSEFSIFEERKKRGKSWLILRQPPEPINQQTVKKPNMSIDSLYNILLRILKEYETRNKTKGILLPILKHRISDKIGKKFNESEYGFKKFKNFIDGCKDIELERRDNEVLAVFKNHQKKDLDKEEGKAPNLDNETSKQLKLEEDKINENATQPQDVKFLERKLRISEKRVKCLRKELKKVKLEKDDILTTMADLIEPQLTRKMSNGPNANDPIFEGEKRKKKQSPIGAPQTSHSQNLDKIENPRSIC